MTDYYLFDYLDEDQWDEDEYLYDFDAAMQDCGLNEVADWCDRIGEEYCSFVCPFHHWLYAEPAPDWGMWPTESYLDWGRRLLTDGHFDNLEARRTYQWMLPRVLFAAVRSLLARVFRRQQPTTDADEIPF